MDDWLVPPWYSQYPFRPSRETPAVPSFAYFTWDQPHRIRTHQTPQSRDSRICEDCMVHALERQPKKSDPEKPKPSELDHKVRLLVKPVTESLEADEDLQVVQGPEFLSGQWMPMRAQLTIPALAGRCWARYSDSDQQHSSCYTLKWLYQCLSMVICFTAFHSFIQWHPAVEQYSSDESESNDPVNDSGDAPDQYTPPQTNPQTRVRQILGTANKKEKPSKTPRKFRFFFFLKKLEPVRFNPVVFALDFCPLVSSFFLCLVLYPLDFCSNGLC